jgi:hypothetical protein
MDGSRVPNKHFLKGRFSMDNQKLLDLFEQYRWTNRGDVDLQKMVQWAIDNGHLPDVDRNELVAEYWRAEFESALAIHENQE